MGGERMIFYKKLNEDGSINMIGTQDELPKDCIKITEAEYNELYQYIQENAVHIIGAEEETEGGELT